MTDLRTALHDIARDGPHPDDIRRRLHQPRRRNLTPVLAAAGVVGVVAVTATTILLTRSPATAPGGTQPATPVPGVATATNPWIAACFGAADISSDLRADIGMGQDPNGPNTAPRAEDYFDICGTHWTEGTWITAPTDNTDGAVPPAPVDLQLIGCVLPDGTYGIFPGTDTTCAALGLPLAVAPDPAAGVIEWGPTN